MAALHRLNISNNPSITGGAFVPVIRSLKENCTLQFLDISGINLGDIFAKEVSAVLYTNDMLRELQMANSGISSTGSKMLMQSLTQNFTLVKLNISNNDVDEILSVKKMIDVNCTLKTLNLSCCKISRENQDLLMQYLEDRPGALDTLDVSEQRIDEKSPSKCISDDEDELTEEDVDDDII